MWQLHDTTFFIFCQVVSVLIIVDFCRVVSIYTYYYIFKIFLEYQDKGETGETGETKSEGKPRPLYTRGCLFDDTLTTHHGRRAGMM